MNSTFMFYLLLAVFIGFGSSVPDDDHYVFPNSHCQQAQDCHIIPGELELACNFNVNKCRCQKTIFSIYRLEFENGKCLMSNFGPCGKNGPVEVGCLDPFKCTNGRCLDSKNPNNIKPKGLPHTFDRKCGPNGGGGNCNFADNLQLYCGADGKCICSRVEPADVKSPIWDVRNYDGNKDCSVGHLGPCGNKDGIKLDCHGPEMSCVNGKCLNAQQPFSNDGQPCIQTTDCRIGLLCTPANKCIKPASTNAGDFCYIKEECKAGLICYDVNPGPWSSKRCTSPSTLNAEQLKQLKVSNTKV